MLAHLEPSVKVKGNAFYTPDGEFDDEFVNVLNEQLEGFISRKVIRLATPYEDRLTAKLGMCNTAGDEYLDSEP